MSDNGKKRTNSFRRLFSSRFFSHKSKEKNNSKDCHTNLKNTTASSSKCNHYQNPRTVYVGSERNKIGNDNNNERIYENLSISRNPQNDETLSSYAASNHSSSSTLVSVSIKHKVNKGGLISHGGGYTNYAARPQVPPKPNKEESNSQYPDVYYHSLEKISDKISPLDEIEIYEASKTQAHPASVGAEIKRVSTNFIISPKKESEVRTLQPTRARSFSFENKEMTPSAKTHDKDRNQQQHIVSKPYNYSAPTSPIPLSYKKPNMPKTVSPYEHIRKTMSETEEKRNSLNRLGVPIKSTISPRLKNYDETLVRTSTPTIGIQKENSKLDVVEIEKNRHKMEAIYWQRLKEMKQKEDEYLLRQSFSSSIKSPARYETFNSISNNNCSTSNSCVVETRSYSLPRGRHLYGYSIDQPFSNSPFARGALERRTDTFVTNRYCGDGDVVYRHPEKLNPQSTFPTSSADRKQMPVFQMGSLTQETRSVHGPIYKRVNQPHKQVSVEGQYQKIIRASNQSNNAVKLQNSVKVSVASKGLPRAPPQPPVRTTSVASALKNNETRNNKRLIHNGSHSMYSESESGSEAGEIQRILQSNANLQKYEDWHGGDGSRIDGGVSDGESARGVSRGRLSRRDDPRRHTLAGNNMCAQHPHHQTSLSTIDIEPLLPRNFPPPANTMLFDDDPGIMSEVETASTGFRRGGKQRSSLPVVRTPSKTLERPLGLVFLQFRIETKRALLPNEITSIDTVKALFVRSFPKQLTMQYMDSPMVKIYIHESSKNMFYELEDVRSHLRDIRDRSILHLFESADMGGGVFPGTLGVGSLSMPPTASSCSGPSSWDQDQNYFSEPEIDSEYHHQHVHKSKVAKAPAYYMGTGPAPSTLPRGGAMLRAFSPSAPPVPADRAVKSITASGEGYMSSPERGAGRPPYEDPYYSQFLGPASGSGRTTITPVIDEEAGDGVISDESYHNMYGGNTAPRPLPRPTFDARPGTQVDDMQRLRVEKMERQLANLTGLVQQALQVPPATAGPSTSPRQEYIYYARTIGTEKSVSFDKSVSFSDDPPDMNSPIQHSPQHSERDRLKPAPPPKPVGLVGQQLALVPQRSLTINVSSDFFNQLRVLQKQSRDLRIEIRNMRRSTLSHAIQMRQLMADTIVKIGALAASSCEHDPESQLTREEEIYRQDMLLMENDLYELEATVERLRGQAANREIRVNMADIERIAMVLSKSSKTVADWKLKFPILQDTMKLRLASEMEKVVRKEKQLEEEPERLELALRRCKKLTGTLVTLKRLACVQEQRLPLADGRMSPGSSQSSSVTAGPSSEEFTTSESVANVATSHNKDTGGGCAGRGGVTGRGAADARPENALDALLDELQTFTKPCERGAGAAGSGRGDAPLRRLHSYPSGSDTDASPPVRARGQHPPKPPVPERHPELLALAARRAPPPPPPRTTSRSPLASPTSPASPPHASDPDNPSDDSVSRQAILEQRHQELLKKQKALQEQYARLQMIQRSGPTLPPSAQPDLKKTGSESNLLAKMNLNLAPAALSGSMTHLPGGGEAAASGPGAPAPHAPHASSSATRTPADPVATTNKVYQTDIL